MEALVQAVQKAGSYQAKDEAARAVHAVMDGLKDRVPSDVLSKLSESSPVREVARLGRLAVQRRQRDEAKAEEGVTDAAGEKTDIGEGRGPSGSTATPSVERYRLAGQGAGIARCSRGFLPPCNGLV